MGAGSRSKTLLDQNDRPPNVTIRNGPQSIQPASGGVRVTPTSAAVKEPFTKLRKDIKSTVKTLSLILMYLGISLPTYITATVHRGCFCKSYEGRACSDLQNSLAIMQYFMLVGHIVFPCTWLLFDKMYEEKLLKWVQIR